jgi:uncharacterized membrane protein
MNSRTAPEIVHALPPHPKDDHGLVAELQGSGGTVLKSSFDETKEAAFQTGLAAAPTVASGG